MIRSISPSSPPNRSRRRGPLGALAAVAAAPLVLSACGTGVTTDDSADAAGGSGETVSVTNCGRELSFDAAPSSIVGMMPSQTELLVRLGAADSLTGQAQTDVSALPDDIAEQTSDVPVISTDAPPAREDLLAAAPDLVVSPTEYEFTAEQGFASIEQLKENGAQAYVATGGCLDRRSSAEVTDVLTDIENLGAILREEDTAEELSSDAQTRLSDVESGLEGVDRLSVAQVFVDGNSLQAIGAGIEADIIAQAGGENVFDPDDPEFADFFAAEISPEEIISRNPEAIVFSVSDEKSEKQTRDYLEETFPDVPAVQEGRLIAVPKSHLFPGTLGNIDAVEQIAGELYPDAF